MQLTVSKENVREERNEQVLSYTSDTVHSTTSLGMGIVPYRNV